MASSTLIGQLLEPTIACFNQISFGFSPASWIGARQFKRRQTWNARWQGGDEAGSRITLASSACSGSPGICASRPASCEAQRRFDLSGRAGEHSGPQARGHRERQRHRDLSGRSRGDRESESHRRIPDRQSRFESHLLPPRNGIPAAKTIPWERAGWTSQKGYGIHGTNAPRSVGHAASHGCIRLRNRDIEKLFTMVQVGDVVQIRGERDEQVAQIFGGGADDRRWLRQTCRTGRRATTAVDVLMAEGI